MRARERYALLLYLLGWLLWDWIRCHCPRHEQLRAHRALIKDPDLIRRSMQNMVNVAKGK